MANPPITIGPFTNVPAPGSPIKSDWPQTISTYVNNLPKGRVTSAASSGLTGVTVEVDVLSLTFNAVTGRYYRITGWAAFQQITALASPIFKITDGANVTKRLASLTLPATYSGSLSVEIVETGLSGSVTRKLRCLTNAGTLNVDAGALLLIEDLGTSL